MGLSVYYGKADRLYENTFFRSFVSQISAYFERNNLDGLLLGFPETDLNEQLRPDVLIFTKNAVLIVDFKHYTNVQQVILPSESDFAVGAWKTNLRDLEVQGGNSSPNPFVQVQRQGKRLSDLLQPAVHLTVLECVLFDSELEIVGTIPGKFQKYFSIANSSNFINVIHDSLNVSSPQPLRRLEDVLSLFDVQPYTDIAAIDAGTIREHEQDIWRLKVKEREVATREQDLRNREQRVLKARAQLAKQFSNESQKKAAEESLRTAQLELEASKQALALAEVDLKKHREIRLTREVDLAIEQTKLGQPSASNQRNSKKIALFVAAGLIFAALAAFLITQSGAQQLDPQFRTCGEANSNGFGNYHKEVDKEYLWYEDRDGDGIACEF